VTPVDRPPWQAMSVGEVADMHGVSIQVLANWRIRGRGPTPFPSTFFKGNRTHYPVYEVSNAATTRPKEPWLQCREFLASNCLLPGEASFDQMIQTLRVYDEGNLWPHMHRPRASLVDLIPRPVTASQALGPPPKARVETPPGSICDRPI
jgi:hypothetical protein